MEIIVKIKTSEDFIQSILDEQDPENAKNLFTDQTLKDTFKIVEINNIEVNNPKIKNPVPILEALKSKSKRWNLLTKNFRKTKRAVKETGDETVRLGKVAARKTKNVTKRAVNTAASIPVGAYRGISSALKEENAKEYDPAKQISIGDDPTQKLVDSAMNNPKINALIDKSVKDGNRIANKGVNELNTIANSLDKAASRLNNR